RARTCGSSGSSRHAALTSIDPAGNSTFPPGADAAAAFSLSFLKYCLVNISLNSTSFTASSNRTYFFRWSMSGASAPPNPALRKSGDLVDSQAGRWRAQWRFPLRGVRPVGRHDPRPAFPCLPDPPLGSVTKLLRRVRLPARVEARRPVQRDECPPREIVE